MSRFDRSHLFGDFNLSELDSVLNEAQRAVFSQLRKLPGIAADVFDAGDAFVIEAEVPGVERSRIDATIEGRKVTVAVKALPKAQGPAPEGMTTEAEAEPARRKIAAERLHGDRTSTWTFAEDLAASGMTGKLENGVLTLTVPKDRSKASRSIDIL